MTGLPCVNCGTPTPPAEAKFFQQTFLCSSCYASADRLYRRLEWELLQVRAVLFEAIRLLVIKKQLHRASEIMTGGTKASIFKFLSYLISLKENPTEKPDDPTTTNDATP